MLVKNLKRREGIRAAAALRPAAILTLLMLLCALIPARALHAEETERENSDTAPVVIRRAEIRGEAGGKLARFSMSLDVRSYDDGQARKMLLPADIAVTRWSVKSGFFRPDGYINRTRDGVEMVLEGKGEYNVKIDFVLPVIEEARRRSVTVPLVQALVSDTKIEIPGRDLEVTAQPDLSMETLEVNDSTLVKLYGGDGEVTVGWRPEIPVRVLEPVVFADQTLHASIGHGVMRIDSGIDYSIVQGGMENLQLKFPAECSLLNIQGRDIRTWEVQDAEDGMQVLEVELEREITGDYSLRLTLEKMLPETEMVVDLPAVKPLNVNREKGQVAVSAARGIHVETHDMQGIGPMDVREIKGVSISDGRQLRLGYRYLDRPFALALRIGKVRAKISAEILTLVRAGMDSMRLDSRINYTIRDAGVFEFTVGLDEGLRLVDITGENINNWQLDETERELTVSLRSQAEGEYELRVETEFDFRDHGTEKVRTPAVTALNVEREIGYVAVLPGTGASVEADELTGISQINVEELPAPLRDHQPDLGFRYIRPGYDLVISVSEIQPEVQAEVQSIYTLGERALEMETEIHYSIRRAGIFQLRVHIPRELRRSAVEGADIDDTSYDEQKEVLTVNLRSQARCDYVLRLVTAKTLSASVEEVEMPIIETLGVRKESGFLAVVTATSVRVKPAENTVEGLDSVGVSDLPPSMLRRAGEVALAFRYFSPPWRLMLDVEPIEPRVTTELFNLLTIGDELLSVSATARYSIANAGVDTLKVKLPAGATAVEFDGDGIRRSEKDEEEGLWNVALQSRRIGDYTLFIDFQIRLSDEQTLIPYSGISTPDVHRETGYLAVTSRPEVELQVSDRDVENLTPIDAREIPEMFTEGLERAPLLLAYRYVSPPYMLRISALPHGAAEVTVAVVETARLSTSITEEGNMITDLACVLRNTRRQYLDLRLPEGSRTWHAFVNNQPVTPLRDGELTKIPVARRDDGEGTQEVRVRYSHAREKLGRMGDIRLDSPFDGIDVMRLGWTLSLPRGYRIMRDRGPIRRVDGEYALEPHLRRLDPDSEVVAGVERHQAVKETDSRQAFRNILALQQSESDKPGESRTALYTGSRPSEAGVEVFQSLIVSKGDPAWLQVHYLRGSVDMPLKGLFVALLLVLCAVIWKVTAGSTMIPIAVMYGCSLVTLALRTLLEGSFHDYLSAATYTFAAAATLRLVSRAFDWARTVWQRRCAHRRTTE